jgi:hypothetical protein
VYPCAAKVPSFNDFLDHIRIFEARQSVQPSLLGASLARSACQVPRDLTARSLLAHAVLDPLLLAAAYASSVVPSTTCSTELN